MQSEGWELAKTRATPFIRTVTLVGLKAPPSFKSGEKSFLSFHVSYYGKLPLRNEQEQEKAQYKAYMAEYWSGEGRNRTYRSTSMRWRRGMWWLFFPYSLAAGMNAAVFSCLKNLSWVRGYSLVAEHLLGTHKAVSLVPSTQTKPLLLYRIILRMSTWISMPNAITALDN